MDYQKEPRKVIINDIANGRELYPIPVINNENDEKPKFTYTIRNNNSRATLKQLNTPKYTPVGCNCCDGRPPYICGDNCKCEKNSIISFNPDTRTVIEPNTFYLHENFYVECGLHCDCRGQCGRQMVPSNKILKNLEVHYLGPKGFGIIAAQPIAAGMPIGEYVGEVTIRQMEGLDYPTSHYQQDLLIDNRNRHFVVDAFRTGNITRFINHSCFPNIMTMTAFPSIPKLNRFPPLPRVVLVAVRDILPGQELCFNYGAEYFIDRKMKCYCYMPNCISPPRDWLKKALSPANVKNEFEGNKEKMKVLMEEFKRNKDKIVDLKNPTGDVEEDIIVLD